MFNKVFHLFFALSILLISSCKNEDDHADYGEAFRRATELSNAGSKAQSVQFLDSFFSSITHPNPEWVFHKYHFKRNYYYYNSIYDSSNLYVDSMLNNLERYPDQKDYVYKYTLAMNDKGDIFFSEGNLDKAFEYYYKSRTAALGIENNCTIANHTYHLGMITYRQAKYNDAIAYFSQALRENKECGTAFESFFRQQELLNNIALCYTKRQMPDSAMFYYNSALNYIKAHEKVYGSERKHFMERAQGVIYGNQAKIYMSKGITDTAEALLAKSITINSQPGNDSLDAQFARLQLAELYLSQQRPAIEWLNNVAARLPQMPNNDVMLRWRLLMSQYYESIDSPSLALQYLESYTRLKDSIQQANSFGQTNVQQLLEFQETQSKMKLLEKDNQLRELYLWLGTVVFAMLLVIALLIYNNYRKSRMNIIELTALNQKVQEQNEDLSITLSVLEKNVREKNSLMRLVAHDLRGPVSGVAYLADRMLETSALEDEDKKSVAVIKDASYNSMKLINELLEKKNRQDLEESEMIDVGDVAKHTISLLQHKANEKAIDIALQEPDEPLLAAIEPAKLSRVLTNIITNAIKFSKANDVIELSMKKDQDKAIITIKDNGIGIPLQYHPIVFNMPSQGRRSGTKGEKSYGLGLSICRQIIEQAKGRIWFDSEEYKGTTFYISLPSD